MTLATSFRECGTCRTRLLILKGVPPLNYAPDPAGKVAVRFSDPRTARFLARGEQLEALEHRHSVHKCGAVAEVTG